VEFALQLLWTGIEDVAGEVGLAPLPHDSLNPFLQKYKDTTLPNQYFRNIEEVQRHYSKMHIELLDDEVSWIAVRT
jgi:hypothetical protein